MTQVTLSQSAQAAIEAAISNGPGADNINYLTAYAAIYNDIKGTNINSGTQTWFSMAGSVNGQMFKPTAAGSFIWNYTISAAKSEGYTISTQNMQNASNAIALSVFQKLIAHA